MVKKFTKSNLKNKASNKKVNNTNDNLYDSDEEYDNENNQKIINEINEGFIITEKVKIK
jgi:hypothetical protein